MLKKLKNIFKFKKAFTLIEIMMVIVIIWILMAATMRFGGDRIGFLNDKNVKEQFVSTYDTLYSNNMMTSYHLWDPYTNLDIDFVLWRAGFDYLYRWYGSANIFSDTTKVDGGEYKIVNLTVDWKDVDSINVSLEPYILGCKINWSDISIVKIDLLVNQSKNYCFKINSDSCRISSISCD